MRNRLLPLAVTKFLTSFNDNAFKMMATMAVTKWIQIQILQTAGLSIHLPLNEMPLNLKEQSEAAEAALVAFGAIVFMLPFVTFPTVAGWLSDRYSKRKVLIAAKFAELGVMICGFFCYLMMDTWGYFPLLAVVSLMALQSTFLSPAYFGILPETFGEDELSSANGKIQLVNFLGIILGTGCMIGVKFIPNEFYIKSDAKTAFLICLPCIIVAMIGILTSLPIKETNIKHSKERFGWQLLTNFFSDYKYAMLTKPLWMCVLGSTFFFSMGTLMMTSLLNFGKYQLHLDITQTSMLTLALALGIGLGSFVAGEFSSGRIEFGLVPIGSLGMTVFFLHLTFTNTFAFGLINCAMLGLFAGFFIIPITVFIQEKAPEAVRGKVLAQSNAVSFLGMLAVSIAMLVLTGGIHGDLPEAATFFTRVRSNFMTLQVRQLYMGAAVVMVVVSLWAFFILPDFLIRLVVLLMAKFVYKIRTFGEDLPSRGPVLLISNHVSYMDALLLSAASKRTIHFVVTEGFFPARRWKRFANWAQLVCIRSEDDGEAYAKARELLTNGEVVCVFPEGRLTTNGQMGEFRDTFKHALPKDVNVPLVPVHLGLLWGSIFSYFFGSVKLRRPQRLPYPVNVSFGKPLTPDCSPFELRSAIADLGVQTHMEPAANEVILPQQFIRMAHRHPFQKLFSDSTGKRISSMTMVCTGYLIASWLRRERSEETIGIMLPNGIGAAATCLGTMFADKVPVFLNYTASDDAVDYAIDACEIATIITHREFLKSAGIKERPEMVFIDDVLTVSTGAKLGAFVKFLLPSRTARKKFFPKHGEDLNSTATILFSSGSSGTPKGVVLSHHNVNSNVNALVRMLTMGRDDVIMGTLPLFHSFGFLTGFWLPFSWGVATHWHPNPLDANGVGDGVESSGGTIMLATPTFLQAYTRKCPPEKFKTLRVVVTGAEKLSPAVANTFFDKFGVMPCEGFGATELSPVVSINVPENVADLGKKTGREGSVGQPLPGIAVKLVDPETGEPTPDGAEGRMLIKGPNVMQGYLNEPERTADVLKDGWYDTGDLARCDASGFIFITGRLSRFSKIGGEMVPHGTIEDALNTALENDEIRLAVTAINDDKRGERLIVLHLKMGTAPKELIQALRDEGLPNLWIPKERDFHQVDELPLLGSGKLNLRALRDAANELTST